MRTAAPELRDAYRAGRLTAPVLDQFLRLRPNEQADALEAALKAGGDIMTDEGAVQKFVTQRRDECDAVRMMEQLPPEEDVRDILGTFQDGEFPAFAAVDLKMKHRLVDAVLAIAALGLGLDRIRTLAAEAGVPMPSDDAVERKYRQTYVDHDDQ